MLATHRGPDPPPGPRFLILMPTPGPHAAHSPVIVSGSKDRTRCAPLGMGRSPRVGAPPPHPRTGWGAGPVGGSVGGELGSEGGDDPGGGVGVSGADPVGHGPV